MSFHTLQFNTILCVSGRTSEQHKKRITFKLINLVCVCFSLFSSLSLLVLFASFRTCIWSTANNRLLCMSLRLHFAQHEKSCSPGVWIFYVPLFAVMKAMHVRLCANVSPGNQAKRMRKQIINIFILLLLVFCVPCTTCWANHLFSFSAFPIVFFGWLFFFSFNPCSTIVVLCHIANAVPSIFISISLFFFVLSHFLL